MNQSDEYINRLRKMPIEQKQAELAHCRQKLDAAIHLQQCELIAYYLDVVIYLSMFNITKERLDVHTRKEAKFGLDFIG